MKREFQRVRNTATALILASSMVLGSAATVFAAGTTEGDTADIKYVSLGDSMANGYGLEGYYEGDKNVNGYLQNDAYSYAKQFAEHLETAHDKNVEHDALAISAMRAEDLLFALTLDTETVSENDINTFKSIDVDVDTWETTYKAKWEETFGDYGDFYTLEEFVDKGGRFNDYANKGLDTEGKISGTINVANKFQTSVKNADVITMGIGNANFGVFLLGRLMNALNVLDGNSAEDAWIEVESLLKDCDEATKTAVMGYYNTAIEMLQEKVPMLAVEPLANALTYTFVSYVLSYNGIINRIVELNPDVDLVLVGLMNTMNGVMIKVDKSFTVGDRTFTIDTIDFGDVLNVLIETANIYLAALPTVYEALNKNEKLVELGAKTDVDFSKADFYFAEADNVEVVWNTINGTYEDENGNVIPNYKNPKTAVRERILEQYDDMLFDILKGMIDGMLETDESGLKLVKVDLDTVETYEEDPLAVQDQSTFISCAVYLAVEDIVVAAADDNVLELDAFNELVGLDLDNPSSITIFNGVIEAMSDMEAINKKSIELAIDNYCADVSETEEYKAWLAGIDKTQIDEDSLDAIKDEMFGITGVSLTDEQTYVFVYILTTTEDYNLFDALSPYITIASGVVLRTTLANAVMADTELLMPLFHLYGRMLVGNGIGCHPSKAGHDEYAKVVINAYCNEYTTLDSITDKVEELGELIAEYGPEVLEKIWNDPTVTEYRECIWDKAMEIKGEVKTYIDETVIPCLETKKADLEQKLTDLYNELVKLEEELKNAAEDVKAQIEAEIAKVKAMIEEVKAALAELNQAIEDLVEYVNDVIAAIDNLIEALQNVNEDLMGYVDAVQDALDKLGEAIEYIEDVIADINDAIDEAQEAFVKAVEDLIALGEQVAEEIKAAAEEAAKIIAKIEEEAKKIPGLIEQAKAFVEEVIAEFQNTVETSLVKDTYLLKEDSYYVAIGDISLADDNNYADLVAKELGLEEKYAVIPGVNFAEDLEAVIAENADTIGQADFVTINLNHNAILDYAIDQAAASFLGSTVTKAEWEAFVGEEGAAAIVKVIDEINKYLVENIPNEALAPILGVAIEQYAFATVSYAMHYAEAINAIHELAPDALVVVVGMYNAFDGLAYEDIELGKYIDVLVKAMNVYGAVYAVITENTMYVDAPEVSFDGISENATFDEYLVAYYKNNYGEEFYANAEGHEYIKEQILGKVEKEYQLGDVNGDGKINIVDVDTLFRYVMKYDNSEWSEEQITRSDVNKDDKINIIDVDKLFRYVMKYDSTLE